MNLEEFREKGHETIDWIYNYYKNMENLDVLPKVKPNDIYNSLDHTIPITGHSIDQIMNDFNSKIIPGMTHWQHPNFFAYFPSNSSYPSLIAEFLMAAMSAQCMSWITSPAATELEQLVMEWLRDMMQLPDNFHGVIQDTASTSTLCSILSARESLTNYKVNDVGLNKYGKEFICYFSDQAHSSIEKAIKITGIGKQNIRYIKTNENYEMIPEEFSKQILEDKANGFVPLHLTVAIGTTGCVAVDPLKEISKIAKEHNVWIHVDAAYAGTAMICEEFRWMIEGVEMADSYVVNAHKWMLTNFDCSLYFVKSKEALIRTFEILPEYLKTKEGESVNNYRDWGIQLGRRFRALKLWFVLRHYGSEGIKKFIRNQISITKNLVSRINENDFFEVCAPVHLNVLCFRAIPNFVLEKQNEFNEKLMSTLNESGKYFFSHTKLKDTYVIRFSIGQTNVNQHHIDEAWNDIIQISNKLMQEK